MCALRETGDSVVSVSRGRNRCSLPKLLLLAAVRAMAIVQAPGELLTLSVDVFRAELNRSAPLRDDLNRYVLFLLTQVAQTAACNRLHRLEQRLACWLLMTHDQVRTDEFQETHEFLSNMLGTDRSEVTIAAGILRKAGLISCFRVKVKVLDRAGLEEAACE